MKNSIKYLLIGLFGFGVIGVGIAVYLFQKPPQSIKKLHPDYIVDAQSLMREYRLDEEKANEKYLGKILLVTGEVKAIEKSMNGSVSFSLEDVLFGITCTVNTETMDELKTRGLQIEAGDKVTLKGRCDGLLTDVRISDCVPGDLTEH